MGWNGYGSGLKYGLASMAFMVARSSLCSRYELKINGGTFVHLLDIFLPDDMNLTTD